MRWPRSTQCRLAARSSLTHALIGTNSESPDLCEALAVRREGDTFAVLFGICRRTGYRAVERERAAAVGLSVGIVTP
jgi:hypothetical protein